MDTNKKKRVRTDETLDESSKLPKAQISFAKFIIIQSEEKGKQVTSLSPFVIEKQLKCIVGTPKNVKYLNNGNLLVECGNRQQTENLLKRSEFFNLKVRVFPHPTLNTSRGVVRCKQLSNCESEREILDGLTPQGVTNVKQISIRKKSEVVKTNTFILTFNSPVLPGEIKVGNLNCKVEVYIPNPLRCFKCQKFGHHEDNCRAQSPTCGRCAAVGHDHTDCTEEEKCANCGEKHQVNSKQCSIWKKEKEILKIKYTENVPFVEARKLFEFRNKIIQQSTSEFSYANAAKPSPECSTCGLLLDKICKLFPEKAAEFRQLVQPQTKQQTAPSSTASTSNKTPSPSKSHTPTQQSSSNTKQVRVAKETEQKVKSPKKKNGSPAAANQKPKEPKPSTPPKTTRKTTRLHRLVVEDTGVSLEVEKIPLHENKYGSLSDDESEMEQEDLSGNAFKAAEDSWINKDDPPDSWVNAPTHLGC